MTDALASIVVSRDFLTREAELHSIRLLYTHM